MMYMILKIKLLKANAHIKMRFLFSAKRALQQKWQKITILPVILK